MALITIPAARRTDWTPGTKTGVVGGIAQYRPGGANQRVTQVNVVTYGADPTGVADSGPGIRAAIAAASAGQVVWFPEGLYRIASAINQSHTKKNITWRGAGIGLSKLYLVGNVTISFGSNSDYQWTYPSSNNLVTAGLSAGSTELTIASTTAFSAGQLIRLSIENETDDAQIMAGAAPTLSVYGYVNLRRPMHRVVSKTSTTLTIEPPLYFVPRAGLSVRVNAAQQQGEGVGLEDLEIDLEQCTNGFPFTFEQCVNCWTYRVKMTNTANYHHYVISSLHTEIRQCWYDRRRFSGSNGAALLFASSSAGLVTESILARVFPCHEVNFGACGNAFCYNVLEAKPEDLGGMGNTNHAPHNSHNVYEGNITPNYQSDGYFGSASADTFFRNWIHGANYGATRTVFTLSFNRVSRDMNLIGNIVGWSGVKNGAVSYGNPNMGNGFFTGSAQPTIGDFWNDWKATATITTRTSATTGTMTLASGSLAVGQLCHLIWGATAHATPNRVQYTVPTGGVSGNVITISGASGTALPDEGTVVQVFMGPSGYQETDQPDAQGTALQRGNYFALAAGGGSIPVGDALGGDTLPDSLIYDSQPSDWPAGFAWPPFDPLNPSVSQSFSRLPAGVWLTTGVWPGDTPAAPSITLNPVSQEVTAGDNVTFSANASGNPAVEWSWTKNGVTIPGATTRFLSLTSVTSLDEGVYVAIATNSQGTASSTGAALSVAPPVVADTTPPSPNPSTIASVTPDSSTQITVVADIAVDVLSPPVEYNHSINGVYQGWQSSPTRVFTGLVPLTSYPFRVKARDFAGNETTESAVFNQSTSGLTPTPHPLGARGSRSMAVGIF